MSELQRLSAELIAERQLLSALAMWNDEDYISCVTLAGAAEEILGKRLRKLELEPSFDNIKGVIVELSRRFGDSTPNLDGLVADM